MRTTLFMKSTVLGPTLFAIGLLGSGQSSCENDDDWEGWDFAETAPDDYTRVDRMGMPAIATAVITSKDEYNQANPTDDVEGDFVDEIVSNVTFFHDALDDDLTSIGLTPCAVDTCVETAASLIIPDTLKIDPASDPGFPNGRALPDQVIDVTLAVVLLDLGNETGCFDGPCTATTLAEIPLNPPENDVAFNTTFPYLSVPFEE